jgi:predicted dienelactone hydrolase
LALEELRTVGSIMYYRLPHRVQHHYPDGQFPGWKQWRPLWKALVIGCFGWGMAAIALPTQAAQRIYVSYGILERSIPVTSLEEYALNGKVDENLIVYAQYAGEAELKQLRDVLLARAELSPVVLSQFLYSPQGEILLKRLGTVIQPEARGVEGFKAIRAALILAAVDSKGLSLLNVLHKFPTRGIRIDVRRSLDIVGELEGLVRQTNQATQIIRQQSASEIGNGTATPPEESLDLRQLGPFAWERQTIELLDLRRKPAVAPTPGSAPVPLPTQGAFQGRRIPVDVYLPTLAGAGRSQSLSVLVISHGLGSDRTTFSYLAQHLASYGFAVLVPEHPGSNAGQLQALITGTAREAAEPSEFIDRPLDISFLLDKLQREPQQLTGFQGSLNLQQVGVIGQSFGGYTALALAGAPINSKQLDASCVRPEETLNLSLALQCQAEDMEGAMVDLRDQRVSAVIAINPITSAVLGQSSLSQIQIPTMIVTGNADTVAPALAEQIRPFTWLTTTNKYLTLMDGGTHFSAIADPSGNVQLQGSIPLPSELVGPNPAIARRYVNALSTAFFQTYVANQPQYSSYLTSAYIRTLSEGNISLYLVRSLTDNQLGQTSTAPLPTLQR